MKENILGHFYSCTLVTVVVQKMTARTNRLTNQTATATWLISDKLLM